MLLNSRKRYVAAKTLCPFLYVNVLHFKVEVFLNSEQIFVHNSLIYVNFETSVCRLNKLVETAVFIHFLVFFFSSLLESITRSNVACYGRALMSLKFLGVKLRPSSTTNGGGCFKKLNMNTTDKLLSSI